MPPNRREFLTAAAGAVFGAGGCASIGTEAMFRVSGKPKEELASKPFPDPCPCSNEVSSKTVGRSVHVDIHSHVFNGDDIPIAGFLHTILRIGPFRPGTQVYDLQLENLRRTIQAAAPGAKEESALLRAHLDPNSPVNLPECIPRLTEKEMRWELSAIHRMLLDFIPGLELQIRHPREFKYNVKSHPHFRLTQKLLPLAHWGRLLSLYRYQIALKLCETYPEVDLFTPALVDFDYWVGDTSVSSMEDQVEVMELVTRLLKGRIHPMVAFDPRHEYEWRRLEERRNERPSQLSPLEIAKDAVENRGFIGVKLYNVMGFSALNSAPRTSRDKALGPIIKELFRWSIKNGVPLMTHSNESNGPGEYSEQLGGPHHWRRRLEQRGFENLRINLGHFGGSENTSRHKPRGWSYEIARMMRRYPNVFADTGAFDVALKHSGESEEFFRRLADLSREHPVLRERLMYGSDWQMIYREPNHDIYWHRFDKEFRRRIARWRNQFMGGNALRYLTLDKRDSLVRRRLECFYAKHGMAHPPWFERALA